MFASFLLDGRSLENKNSVRFTETSRKILESNDWIVQRLDGKIYLDKRLQPHNPESGRDARYLVGFFLGDLVIHSDFQVCVANEKKILVILHARLECLQR